MKKLIKQLIRHLVPDKLKNIILENEIKAFRKDLEFRNISYSQEGEDLFLLRFFGEKKNGFYVDVGAHHPKRFSNTYIFYMKGWRGINIDAMPGSMKLFNKTRPHDINLEIGISDEGKKKIKYYIFNEPALNTFSSEVATEKNGLNNYQIIDTVEVPVEKIQGILGKHLPKNQSIDFMSIDVEGLDFEVLKSNNWDKFRPHVIAIESSHLLTIEEHFNDEISQFLKKKDYFLIGKTFKTLFFQDNNFTRPK